MGGGNLTAITDLYFATGNTHLELLETHIAYVTASVCFNYFFGIF